MASIYEYSGFYTQAKVVSDSIDKPSYTNREMLQKLYNTDSVFWSKAERGDGNSTQIAASEVIIDKKSVDSTEYNLYLSRFKNLPNIKFAKWKAFQDNTIGIANTKNAQASRFKQVDAEWVASRFMTGSEYLSSMDKVNRFFTTTGWKFDSTKWGQNMAINPRPQFTRTCDIRGNNRASSVIKNKSKDDRIFNNDYTIGILPQSETKDNPDFGLGMGRYYSEAIDDNATQIYLQFGVPKFNSLISFFINAVSYEDSYIANYGRVPIAYNAASAVFGFVVWCAFPLITTTIVLLKKVIQLAFSHSLSYYYMEPTMHTYWTSVNLIINQIAAELGIMAPLLKDDETGNTADADEEGKKVKMGTPVRISSSDIREMSKYMPNAFNPDTGYIDVYHLATRGQMLANYLNKREYAIYNARDKNGNAVGEEVAGWLGSGTSFLDKTFEGVKYYLSNLDRKMYLKDFLKRLLKPDSDDKDFVSQMSNVQDIGDPSGTAGKYSFRNYEENKTDETRVEENIKRYADSLGIKKEIFEDEVKTDEDFKKKVEAYNKKEIDRAEYNDALLAAAKSLYEKKQKESNNQKTLEQINKEQSEASKTKVENSSSYTIDGFLKGSYEAIDWIQDKIKDATQSVINWTMSGADTFDAVVRDGGGYAIFNVDFNGQVNESWSNSSSDIETAGALKSVSKGARDIRFNLTGGLLATAVGQVVDGLKNIAMAAVDTFSFGLSNVVASILGGGYADLPKKWDDSDFSFPKISYTMQLVAPYGNPISQLQNIYIPLAMIMAGSLPLQAGKSSYTSPFLCSIFNKGVQDVRLGMITDVSVSRGITNMPFSRTKRMLSCEVTFSVTDFSTRLVAPINSSPFKTLFSLNWDDDSPTAIYFATLAARDLFTNKYFTPRTKLKLARMAMAFSQMTSSANWAMRAGEFFQKPFGFFAWERRFPENQRNSL